MSKCPNLRLGLGLGLTSGVEVSQFEVSIQSVPNVI